MSTIYKYPLDLSLANCGPNRRPLENLRLEEVLHVGLDPTGEPCVWARVFPCCGINDCLTLDIVGTGCPVSNSCNKHVGSFVQGPFVWHVFTT